MDNTKQSQIDNARLVVDDIVRAHVFDASRSMAKLLTAQGDMLSASSQGALALEADFFFAATVAAVDTNADAGTFNRAAVSVATSDETGLIAIKAGVRTLSDFLRKANELPEIAQMHRFLDKSPLRADLLIKLAEQMRDLADMMDISVLATQGINSDETVQ